MSIYMYAHSCIGKLLCIRACTYIYDEVEYIGSNIENSVTMLSEHICICKLSGVYICVYIYIYMYIYIYFIYDVNIFVRYVV